METIKHRIGALDLAEIAQSLDAQGWAPVSNLLNADECQAIASLYSSAAHFRSQVQMARHGFGKGEYRYFSYPLPPLVAEMRNGIYPHLVPIANRWHERLQSDVVFPADHADFF